MPEEKVKSAIDEIYSISERLESMEKYLVIIDNNIKLLNNKVSKLSKSIKSDEAAVSAVAPKLPKIDVPKIVSNDIIPARSKDLIIGDIKLFGYIFSKNNSPIKGVNVTIYNEIGEVIKEKITNEDGHWSVRLPSGKYGVEYNHTFGSRKFKPINRVIELINGIKEFEVT